MKSANIFTHEITRGIYCIIHKMGNPYQLYIYPPSSIGFDDNIGLESFTLNTKKNGLNGLSSGKLMPDTIYDIYLLSDQRRKLKMASIMAWAFEKISIPEGYTLSRKIGHVLTNRKSQIERIAYV